MNYTALASFEALEIPELHKYFTERELEGLEKGNSRRRNHYRLISRAISKMTYLSIKELEETNYLNVNSSNLQKFSQSSYQKIEILNTPDSDRYLTIYDQGHPTSLWLSASYSGSYAAICLSQQGAVNIDIETALNKVPAFYQQNFTRYEREWVYQNITKQHNEDELFTFLWTLKEGLIKSGQTRKTSAWYIPSFATKNLPTFNSYLTGEEIKGDTIINDGYLDFEVNFSTRKIDTSLVLTTTQFR